MAQTNSNPATSNSVSFSGQGWNGPQPDVPKDATNWGKSIEGVRLLVYMTNQVVEAGNPFTVLAVVANSSTNSFRLQVTGLPSDFDVMLANGYGGLYHLIPPPLFLRMNSIISLDSMGRDARLLNLSVGTNIERGDYALQATRNCISGNSKFKVESNVLRLHVR